MAQAPANETNAPKDSPERAAGSSINYAPQQYTELVTEVDSRLSPHRKILYLPIESSQELANAHSIDYLPAAGLGNELRRADAIICISRDEKPDPNYTDQYPERNIALTVAGISNVDTSAKLFKLAQAEGNSDIQFIATGRMHNRQIRMMLALPVIADAAGINAEDAYHISESRFKQLLGSLLASDTVPSLMLDDERGLDTHLHALRSLLENAGYEPSNSSKEALQEVAKKLYDEYKNYPRISTSRLIAERAAEQGVSPKAISEEDGSVDTISSLINTTEIMNGVGVFEKHRVHKVVIVAGSDHLPRVTWLANHILPDNIDIICVESPVPMSDDEYATSCERELNSLIKGSSWIGGTRDLEKLNEIVEAGYFGASRIEADDLARAVSSARALGNATIKNS